MIAQLRSEAYKSVTTRTNVAVLSGMVALVGVAIVLHALGLPLDRLATADRQRGILIDVVANIGALFAALLGALSITSEFRTGTIRPTLLASPGRRQVVVAKAFCSLAAGAMAGLLAALAAVAAAAAGLAIRGLSVEVSAADAGRLVLGSLVGGALWAAIGLGVASIVRSQVPTVVGLFVWLLFVENVLAGDLPTVHKYVPGGLAQTLAGASRDAVLSSAPLAGVLLIAYAVAATMLGAAVLARRDVA